MTPSADNSRQTAIRWTPLPLLLAVLQPAFCDPVVAAELTIKVVDEAGRILPSRVLIRPARHEDIVPKGATELAIGRDRWFMSPGDSTVDCPSGPVLVRVEHGPEFIRFKEIVSVPEEGLSRTITLERWINLRERGYLCGENHLHVDTKTLAPMLVCEGLDFGSSMTWWNGPDQKRPIPNGAGSVRPLSFAGRSVSTSVFDAELEYAWGAAYLQGMTEPLSIATNRGRANLDYLKSAKQAGGIVHYQAGWSREVLLDALLGFVDTVNICNNNFHLHRYQQRPHYANLLEVDGFPTYRQDEAGMRRMNFETYYRLLNCGLKLAAGAGSATGVKQNPAGFNRAYVRCAPEASLDEFYRAWADGKNFVTNGPMVFLTARAGTQKVSTGDTLKLDTEHDIVQFTVETHCQEPHMWLDRVELIVNGHVAWSQESATINGMTQKLHEGLMTVPLKVRRGSWVAARCIAVDELLSNRELVTYSHGKQEDRYRMRPSRNRFAHTSPIYIEFNGRSVAEEPGLRDGLKMLDRFEDFTRKNSADEFLKSTTAAIATARAKLQSRLDAVALSREQRVQKLRDLKCIVFEKNGEVVEVHGNGAELWSQDLSLLSGFTEVTDLSFERVPLRNLSLAHLSKLKRLEWLNLYQTQIGDTGLAHLKQLRNLKLLPIGATQVTDSGMRHLGMMPQLEYLGLRGNMITDDGVAELRNLKRLTGLHLGETHITDEAIPHLKDMKRLRRLWLHDTKVSDRSVGELVRMNSLRELHVYETKISEDGISRLKKELPRCRVVTSAN